MLYFLISQGLGSWVIDEYHIAIKFGRKQTLILLGLLGLLQVVFWEYYSTQLSAPIKLHKFVTSFSQKRRFQNPDVKSPFSLTLTHDQNV